MVTFSDHICSVTTDCCCDDPQCLYPRSWSLRVLWPQQLLSEADFLSPVTPLLRCLRVTYDPITIATRYAAVQCNDVRDESELCSLLGPSAQNCARVCHPAPAPMTHTAPALNTKNNNCYYRPSDAGVPLDSSHPDLFFFFCPLGLDISGAHQHTLHVICQASILLLARLETVRQRKGRYKAGIHLFVIKWAVASKGSIFWLWSRKQNVLEINFYP